MTTKNTDAMNTVAVQPVASGQCPVCGAKDSLLAFTDEAYPVHVGERMVVVENLSGEKCQACEEVFFDDDSAERFASGGEALILEERKVDGANLRAVRERLGLTQSDFGLLIGGGTNGVGRYERGTADPGPAAFHLAYLLGNHPDLVAELPGVSVERIASIDHTVPRAAKLGGHKPKRVIPMGSDLVVVNVVRPRTTAMRNRYLTMLDPTARGQGVKVYGVRAAEVCEATAATTAVGVEHLVADASERSRASSGGKRAAKKVK